MYKLEIKPNVVGAKVGAELGNNENNKVKNLQDCSFTHAQTTHKLQNSPDYREYRGVCHVCQDSVMNSCG